MYFNSGSLIKRRKVAFYVDRWFGRPWKAMLWTFLLVLLYVWINYRWQGWYGVSKGVRCEVPADELEDMRWLGREVQSVLELTGVSYFLLYGSLWGALRIQDILPWDIDIDMGINQDTMPVSIKHVVKEMNKRGLTCFFNSWTGVIEVYSGRYKSQVDIMLYSDTYGSGTMHRVGWETYLTSIHYRSHHSFPYKLISGTLPTLPFIKTVWPVPQGGNEIMKYHYPDDWWKEVKPEGC